MRYLPVIFSIFPFWVMNAPAQQPDSVTINYLINTAFVQDTIHKKSSVSIRGGGIFGDWSLEKGLRLNHLSGDYWTGSIRAAVGTAMGTYKVVTQTASGTGWDRVELNGTVPATDTTITLFTSGYQATYSDPVTGEQITRDGNWIPLEIAKNGSDSIAVHFRVNMQSLETFPRSSAEVYVRGSMIDDSWNITSRGRMYPEVRHDDLCCGGGIYEADRFFYSRTVLVDPAKKGSDAEYKFTFNNGGTTNWEEGSLGSVIGNRIFQINSDTTLEWKWWGEPNNNPLDIEDWPTIKFSIDFEVDLFHALNTNGFNPDTDQLLVRAGFGGTSLEIEETLLSKPQFGTVFTGRIDSIRTLRGANSIWYQFVRVGSGSEKEEYYTDFYDTSGFTTGPKFRKIKISDDFVPDDSIIYPLATSDFEDNRVHPHRMPFFERYSPSGAEGTVKITMNLLPLFCQTRGDTLIDPLYDNFRIHSGNFDSVSVAIFDPCMWCPWPFPPINFSNDGMTQGDENADDYIWTYTLSIHSTAHVTQNLFMGLIIGEKDGFKDFYTFNLLPENNPTAKFHFGQLFPKELWAYEWSTMPENQCWTVDNVNGKNGQNPSEIILYQNYPNPFNPSTVISFNLPKPGLVEFDVFNILGQKIRTFNYFTSESGFHQTNFAADGLSSGTYFLKMRAGNSERTIRMVLLR